MIINAGIEQIVYQSGYADPMSADLLAEAGISLVRFGPDIQEVNR